jgi:hypothetical protein
MDTRYGRSLPERDIPLSKGQLAVLHVAKKQLSLDDDIYRNLLEIYGGVSSSKHLKLDGFKRVMEHLARLGFESTSAQGRPRQPQRAPRRDPDGVPYPAQLSMIEGLLAQVGFNDPERRQGFCRRVIGRPWPQTRAEANKVFEALKAMVKRGWKPQ